jgi:hypothetical protein
LWALPQYTNTQDMFEVPYILQNHFYKLYKYSYITNKDDQR